MQKFHYILSASIATYAFYKIYKYYKNKHKEEKKVKYFVDIYEEILTETSDSSDNYIDLKNNNQRVYNYKAVTGSFECLENEYKESLYGYNSIKNIVDETLKEYLKKERISNKRVMIITDEWIADIEIETNMNPNTLVFKIIKNY
jgi:hypothetical protein